MRASPDFRLQGGLGSDHLDREAVHARGGKGLDVREPPGGRKVIE